MKGHNRPRRIRSPGQIARIRAVYAFRREPFRDFSRLFPSQFVQRSRKVSLQDSGVVFFCFFVAGEDHFHDPGITVQ